jgi:tryptophan synthase beta chain
MQALRLLSETEGIIPAIESAHALAGALRIGRELGPDAILAVCLSGRGDKDMDTAARYFDLYDRRTAVPEVVEGAPEPVDEAKGEGTKL